MVGRGGCTARQGWKWGWGVVTYTGDLVRLRRVFLLHSMGFWEVGPEETVEMGGVFAPVWKICWGVENKDHDCLSIWILPVHALSDL